MSAQASIFTFPVWLTSGEGLPLVALSAMREHGPPKHVTLIMIVFGYALSCIGRQLEGRAPRVRAGEDSCIFCVAYVW